jgi:P-type Mg2+ transporter
MVPVWNNNQNQVILADMLYPGLSEIEVRDSLKKHGSNTVRSNQESNFVIFKRQLSNPLIYLLVLSAFISFVLKDYLESGAIFFIIVVDTIIGFSQEYKSKKLLSKISLLISSKIEVIRSSNRLVINKSELVVGDIVLLKLGDIIPADCVLLKSDDIRVNESILTGESELVYKSVLVLLGESEDPKHLLYAGSSVSNGSAVARIIAVGDNTKFGSISQLALNTKKPSQFEKNSSELSKGFSIVGILFLFSILGLQLLTKPDGISRWPELAIFAITLMVSLLPEALPIITNLTIAQKAFSLGKKGLIVRHLTALEDLGNIDVLCTDKTGTLTENKQKVVNYIFEKNTALEQLWLLSTESADDIDKAAVDWLNNNKKIRKEALTIDDYTDIPFDPKVRFSGRILKDIVLYKGSSESILDLCTATNIKKEELLSAIGEKSRGGLRAISYAVKNLVTGKVTYLGSLFLADEIKPDAEDIVSACKLNGVDLKILTGDSLEVAMYIAQKAGLVKSSEDCVDATKLPYYDEKLLEYIINTKKVFARTRPEDKYRIIQILQKKHVVGYLGDGINDAPALAIAEVGIVVDTASDIAKSTADIILLKHELKTIIEGIQDGRKVFENVQKYLKYTLIGNFGNAFTIGVISLLLPFEPILAIQVLLVNLISDLPMFFISGDSVDSSELKSPRKQDLHKMITFCILLGLVSTVFDFIFIATHRFLPEGQIQTSWFFFSICTEMLLILSVRSKLSVFKSPKIQLSMLLLMVLCFALGLWLAVSGFQLLQISTLTIGQIVPIFMLAVVYLLISDIAKQLYYKFIDTKISYD